jgi:DNA-binding response OmpR family regulator
MINRSGDMKMTVSKINHSEHTQAVNSHVRNGNSTTAMVLVVDDDPLMRTLIGDVLESAGYQPIEAQNGREASCMCSEQNVSLIIMDLVMPEREGIETIREIRRDYPVLPIIAISGAFEGTMLKAAQYLGANATIRKPFGMQLLLDTIRQLLAVRFGSVNTIEAGRPAWGP